MKLTTVRLLAVLAWFTACSAFGQNYTISTFAGSVLPILNIPGAQASLGFVHAVAADSAGNVFIVEEAYPIVVRLDHITGILSLVAGNGTSGFSGDNGPATSAQLSSPTGVAVDSAGNVYVADGNRIREVSNGVITTVAGNGAAGIGGDNGPATSAQLSSPAGVAVDSLGNFYIVDGNRIRKVSSGVITTVAGNVGGGFSGDNGLATSAQLSSPSGLAVDSAGNLYIADTLNNRIRKVSNGVITTVAGSGDYGTGGDSGPATSAQLTLILPFSGLAVDSGGNLYISASDRVRKVSNGMITTVAGGGALGPLVGDNGPATSAPLLYVYGVAVDSAGNLYIADHDSERIRKVSNGVITTAAGGGYSLGDGGPANSAQLTPQGVAVDIAGTAYVADFSNGRIRKISSGVITTVAGTGTIGGFANGFSGDNGPASSAQLSFPSGVAVDSGGNLYIADNNNLRIRKVSNGVITTVAGNGTSGFGGDNGPATSAQLIYPQGVAVDSAGNLYISEADRIRKVSNGMITTVAGTSGFPGGFSGDNGPATGAQLLSPNGLAVDSAGNLYIADSGNGRIRKVSNGVITTVAGGGAALGDGGPATSAQLSYPQGVTVDSAGNLYIADTGTGNGRIRKVSNGLITTVAGGGASLSDNGPAASAQLSSPYGVAVDSAGHVYFSDGLRIRLLTPNACTYALNLGAQAFTSQGGTGSITITTQFACPWSVSNVPSGVVLTSSASGAGNGTVTFQVLANGGGDLSNTFTIAGQTFTVEQEAVSIPSLSFIGSMPHIAAEENWTTMFTLVNNASSLNKVRFSLFGSNIDASGSGNPLQLPLDLPQQPNLGVLLGASLDNTLSPFASWIVSTAGQGIAPVLTGSAQVSATGALGGFAIFHRISDAQEAVVPLTPGTPNPPSYLLAYDNTGGIVTAVAVANVSPQTANIGYVIRDDTGAQIGSGTIAALPGDGQTSFDLTDPVNGLPVTINKRGTVEFDTPSSGQISVLGIRNTPQSTAQGMVTTLTTVPALASVGTGGGSFAFIASGGDGWQTTFVLVNTGSGTASATLSFLDPNGNPLSLPLSFPQTGAVSQASSVNQPLAAGATLLIESTGAPTLLTGSAQLTTTGNVSGFVIFRHNGQEAVVPMESRNAGAYVLAFDNTSGTATGIAVNNVSGSTQTVNIPVVLRDDSGNQLATDTLTLAANGDFAGDLAQYSNTLGKVLFPQTANIRGTVEFDAPAGVQIGVIGIRTPAALTYTTLPALAK